MLAYVREQDAGSASGVLNTGSSSATPSAWH